MLEKILTQHIQSLCDLVMSILRTMFNVFELANYNNFNYNDKPNI